MRSGALLVAILLAACHGTSGGFGSFSNCEERSSGAAAATAPKIPPADDDFALLLAYRNYYSLDRVGEFEHHFAVWFQCIEPTVSYFAVSPDGQVRNAGGWWGGMGVRDGDPPPVPPEQEGNAKLAMAQHERDYDGASGERIQYLGSYREVALGEIVPDDGPGDPYKRGVWHQTVTVRADAELTGYDGTAELSGGYTRMCWEDTLYRDCSQPHWIDAGALDGVGRPQLAALTTDKPSPQSSDAKAAFEAKVMAAARARVAGEAGTPIADILAQQGTGFLPEGFAPPVRVGFTIYARWGKGVDQTSGAIAVDLDPREIARGNAHGEGSTTIAGVTLRATVEATLVDQDKVSIAYTLADDRKTKLDGAFVAPATVWTDGDAVVFRFLSLPEESNNHTHDPPWAQHFPGAEGHDSIDVYLGVSATVDPWYP